MAAVADAPWEYEERLQRVRPELRRLELFVLEKHDLALSEIKSEREMTQSFLLLVETLFGEMARVRAQARVAARRGGKG